MSLLGSLLSKRAIDASTFPIDPTSWADVADSGAAPRIMDAFYTGLALGTFFCCLIYAAMAMSAFLLNRLRSTPLRTLPLPLSAAFASCLLLTVLIYVLASHGA